jgi:hypothetical protein
VNWGRFAQMLREWVPDAVQAGGASVVVRGGKYGHTAKGGS